MVETTEGLINFQHGKSPFVGSLPISQISIKQNYNDKESVVAAISSGVVQVDKANVKIVTEEAILKEHIDLHKAEKQRREIEQKLKQALPKSEQLKEELTLKRVINKIKTKKGV